MRNFIDSINKLISRTMVFFYAVARGRNPGVYATWDECKAEVDKYPRPIFKKFPSKSEAENFVTSQGGSSSVKAKLTQELSAQNGLQKNYRLKKADVSSTLKFNSPYDEMERRLKDWAEDRQSLSQLDVQSEASKIANELGIENFNQYGGWLKYHVECNPVIYKSLRVQNCKEDKPENPVGIQSTIVEHKLSSLEKKIAGLTTTTTGISVPGRVKLLEQALHSMHNELHDIKRHLSTNTSLGSSEISYNKRKRRKIEDSEEEGISKSSSDSIKSSNNSSNFDIDEQGFVNVFTDGACSGNGKRGACAGIGVWFGDNHPLNVSRPVADGSRATNNLAEIQAVTAAASQATKAGVKKLKINTDSQFLISCITQWMPKWKKNGWRKADGGNVINKIELLEMESALKPLTISWNHVRGHAGVHGNEMADELARAGAASQNKK